MNVRDKSNWTNKDILYLKNITITEYDLSSGGLSVIKEYKLLDQKYIDNLDEMAKEKKNIIIGKLQAKIPTLAANMVVGFGNAREAFVKLNNISNNEILSIKKDALFIINHRNINGDVSENLHFKNKNTYSSYIRLNDKEFYYNPIMRSVDVKGISDENLEKQRKYLLADICKFLGQSEKISINMLYQNLKEYRSKYLNKKLPIETYRNLDSGMFDTENFELDTVDDSLIDIVDITYNYVHYILPMIKLLLRR